MSWLRVEGRAPQHAKIAPLSDAAFRLHFTAMCWCVEHLTDGAVPGGIPATLPAAPRGKKLASALEELEDAGLWHKSALGWTVHDFLDWNMSAAETLARKEARARAGAAGGLAKAKQTASKRLASATAKAKQTASNGVAKLYPDTDTREEPPEKVDPRSAASSQPDAREEPQPPRIRCPADLTLTHDQAQNALLTMGLSADTLAACAAEYRGRYLGKPDQTRTLDQWRSGLWTMVCRDGREVQKRLAEYDRGERSAVETGDALAEAFRRGEAFG